MISNALETTDIYPDSSREKIPTKVVLQNNQRLDLRGMMLEFPTDYGLYGDKWHYQEFEGTPFEIDIPARGYATTEEATKEIESLTTETFGTEGFNQFYRHMNMLARFGTPQRIAEFIPIIFKRTEGETKSFLEEVYPGKPSKQRNFEWSLDNTVAASLELFSKDSQNKLSKSRVEQLFDKGLSDGSALLRAALIFDKRNSYESSNISERIEHFIASNLINEDSDGRFHRIMEWVNRTDSETIHHSLIEALKKSSGNLDEISQIIQMSARHIGIEIIRRVLRDEVEIDNSFKPTLDQVFSYIGIDMGEDPATNLERDVYDKVEFSNYAPNDETIEYETALLEETISKGNVLDVACGTGRHLLRLVGKDGIHVAGIDISKKHIAKVREANPESDVQVASWFDLPFTDQSFDYAYCLGRSFTHNTTIPDAMMYFSELRRVLKDDGVVIIDLPNVTKGDYREEIERTRKVAEERGIKNILVGLINDSPDMKNYFDRFAPSENQFMLMATAAGFRAEKLPVEKKYKGVSGKENVNTYWKLTKTSFPPDSVLDWREVVRSRKELLQMAYFDDSIPQYLSMLGQTKPS